jgi:hypothetical protein
VDEGELYPRVFTEMLRRIDRLHVLPVAAM